MQVEGTLCQLVKAFIQLGIATAYNIKKKKRVDGLQGTKIISVLLTLDLTLHKSRT